MARLELARPGAQGLLGAGRAGLWGSGGVSGLELTSSDGGGGALAPSWPAVRRAGSAEGSQGQAGEGRRGRGAGGRRGGQAAPADGSLPGAEAELAAQCQSQVPAGAADLALAAPGDEARGRGH